MSISSFEALYEQVCRSLEIPAEPLQRGDTGCSFAVHVAGIQATIFHEPERGANCALVMVNLGLPDPREEGVALLELLEANFIWISQSPALVASRNALTGELFIQFAYAFAQAHAEDLLARIEALATASSLWPWLQRRPAGNSLKPTLQHPTRHT